MTEIESKVLINSYILKKNFNNQSALNILKIIISLLIIIIIFFFINLWFIISKLNIIIKQNYSLINIFKDKENNFSIIDNFNLNKTNEFNQNNLTDVNDNNNNFNQKNLTNANELNRNNINESILNNINELNFNNINESNQDNLINKSNEILDIIPSNNISYEEFNQEMNKIIIKKQNNFCEHFIRYIDTDYERKIKLAKVNYNNKNYKMYVYRKDDDVSKSILNHGRWEGGYTNAILSALNYFSKKKILNMKIFIFLM